MHFHAAAAGIDHLERLSRRQSPVHRMSAISKIAVTFVFIAIAVSVPQNNPARLIQFFFYPAIMLALSGTPLKPVIARLGIALPFVLAFGITNIVLDRQPVFYAGSFAVTHGMISCWTLFLKTLLCVFAALLLIATTPFSAIARALTAPAMLRVFGLQFVMTYRYIAVLLEEAGDSWTAYMLRAPGVKAIKLRDMGAFLGALLLRSAERASRVYSAMKCRGFSGIYVSAEKSHFNIKNLIFVLAWSAALVFIRFFDINSTLGALIL